MHLDGDLLDARHFLAEQEGVRTRHALDDERRVDVAAFQGFSRGFKVAIIEPDRAADGEEREAE